MVVVDKGNKGSKNYLSDLFSYFFNMESKANHLKTWLQSWVESESIPGGILGIFDKEGKELFYSASSKFGQPNEEYRRDTIFRIYSMTKPITSIAALILIERNVISIDDEVSKYIPSFQNATVYVSGPAENPVTEPLKKPLTIFNLLTHTSGFTYGFFGNNVCDQILKNNVGEDYKSWFHNTPIDVLCDKIAESPLCFQPGTHFHYGLSTDVLGRIIEIASGVSLADFFQKEIFIPLGMLDTGFKVPTEKLNRLAEIYELAPGQGYKPSLNEERDRAHDPVFYAGGGGLVSTLDDYAKFACCLLRKGKYSNGQLISEDLIEKMTTNLFPDEKELVDMSYDQGFSEVFGPGFGFGLGVSILTDPSRAKGGCLSGKGEYGWGGVAATSFLNDPEKGITAIFLTQLIAGAAVYPVRAQIRWLSHWLITDELK